MYNIAGTTASTSYTIWPCTDGTTSCAGGSVAKFVGVVTVTVAAKTLFSGLTSGTYNSNSYLWLAETGRGAIRQIHLSNDCALALFSV